MKPAQKIVLGCRQTSEAIGRLSDWLENNPAFLGASIAAIREEVDSVAAHLAPIARAADSPPGIGILGTAGTGKTDLVFALLAARGPTTLGELGQRPIDGAMLRGLLPPDHESGGCAVLRFVATEMPPTPRGYAIRVGLLSVLDVVSIVAGAAIGALAPPVRQPDGGHIDRLMTSVATQLSPQAVPGLSERDVLDLREALTARWPDSPLLGALAATRYWEGFRDMAAHLAERERRRVLAVLWNESAVFNALFHRLCDGIERLGQGTDAYCAPEALLGKDKSTGWMTRHPRSIIDAATLLALDPEPGITLNMMNRFGQAVDVERSVVAALVAELPLHVGGSRLSELAPAEILDFPVAPPIRDGERRPSSGSNKSPSELSFAAAVQAYARMKALYLFERACHRRDVTSLVVVASPDREDDTYTDAIGDWVAGSQGANAQARGMIRRGLFIATGAPSEADDNTPWRLDEGHGGPTLMPTGMAGLIRNVIGSGQDWPDAWTPHRPLQEVFHFQRSDATAPNSNAAERLVPVTSENAAALAETDVTALVKALAGASDTRVKHLQLNHALRDIRRRLRGTLLRYHTSNDPSAIAEWRRGIAVVIQDRLQFMIERGRLGHLQHALLPTEVDLRTALAASQASTPHVGSFGTDPVGHARTGAASWREHPAQADPFQLPPNFVAHDSAQVRAERLTGAAIAHWMKSMRRAARSPRLARDLRIDQILLQNLIDELQAGALRIGLGAELASAFLRSGAVEPGSAVPVSEPADRGQFGVQRRDDDVLRLAAYAYRIISAYLEVLTAVHGRSSTGLQATRALAYNADVADIAAAGQSPSTPRQRLGARRTTRPVAKTWEASFAALVEDNIAAAHLLAGRGDQDRELGELIQLFAPGPYEVQP
jgi:hypothetical protein